MRDRASESQTIQWRELMFKSYYQMYFIEIIRSLHIVLPSNKTNIYVNCHNRKKYKQTFVYVDEIKKQFMSVICLKDYVKFG